MSLSERQKLKQLQEYAREEDEKILDVFNCVERLHDADLRKAIVVERGEWVLAKIPRRNRGPGKASFQRLARALPRHIMGCLLARQPAMPLDDAAQALTTADIDSATCFGHIAKALQLLCSLCECASTNRQLREVLLLQLEFGQEVVDAVNLVLVAMAGPEADRCLEAAASKDTMQEALDRAAMVPAALRALAYAFTAAAAEPTDVLLNWHSIVEALLRHPRGAVLLDAAFDATRTLVAAVRTALVSQESSSEDAYGLAFSAGGAMELLSYLCTTPLFYHRLMVHDPSGAAPLRLILACLALHDAPLAAPPYCRLPPPPRAAGAAPAGVAAPPGPLACFAPALPPYSTSKGKGAAELLVARGFALLIMLAEFEEPSYMDHLFQHPDTRRLAQDILERAAAYIAQVLLRPGMAQHAPAAGEAQMCINILRAAEFLCDDSNFKSGLIQRLSVEIALVLSMDPALFKSRWGAGEEAVAYHASDEILINSISNYAMEGVERLERASKKLFGGGGGKQAAKARVGQQLALERAMLLFKLIGNLQCQGRDGQASPRTATDTFALRLLAALRQSPIAMAQALHNLRQLQALLAPFGPPNAREDVELLAEVDLALISELAGQLERALQAAQQQQAQQQAQLPRQVPPPGAVPAAHPPPATAVRPLQMAVPLHIAGVRSPQAPAMAQPMPAAAAMPQAQRPALPQQMPVAALHAGAVQPLQPGQMQQPPQPPAAAGTAPSLP